MPRTPGTPARPRAHAVRVLAVLAALALSACGTTGPATAPTRAELQARVARNPNDAAALRDLGILMAQAREYGPAHDVLERAYARRPDDGPTLYFLGLTSEVLGQPETALRVYERYDALPPNAPYRDALRGRYGWLLRERVKASLRQALVEDTVATAVRPGTVGVLPLAYRGTDERFAPLGRGLAEVISTDLAAVQSLTVVERVRLQALLGEFELARRGALQEGTAPRFGHLLRAERLVGGEYDVRAERLRVDAGVWTTAPDSLTLETTEGGIADLLRVQQRVVFALLEALGVEPTPAERERIETVPTEDLLAFLAFSRALQAEDTGNYARAALHYAEAVRRDPNFALAVQRQAESAAIGAAAGAADATLSAAAAEALGEGDGPNDLVGRRSAAMGATLGSHLVPGAETRQAAVEGTSAGILGPIPDPPPPPAGGGE